MRRALVVLVAAAVGSVAADTPPAEAGFPGLNGKIVFVSDRAENRKPELYAIGVDGSRRANVSRDPAAELAPSLSPDGTRVAYVSSRGRSDAFVVGGELWVATVGGRARTQITRTDGNVGFDYDIRPENAEPAAWSPDGQRLAFALDGEIVVARADGSGRTVVARGRSPHWSPDGTRIAFVEDETPAVSVVGADGTGARRLAVRAGAGRPRWSPDGERLLFHANGEIRVVEADGAGERVAVAIGAAGTWAPGGESILFTRGGEILVTRMNGSGERLVTRGRLPAWSPDGSLIAFVRANQVFVVRPDGSEERQVTREAAVTVVEAGPQWFPGGRRLLFGNRLTRNDDEIYVSDADGRGARALTTNGVADTDPAWSPDGRQVVFVSARGGRRDLHLMSANGRGVRRLVRLPGWEANPAWSPDGTQVAFERQGLRRSSGVYVIRADGTDLRFLAVGREPAWAPDGTRIAVADGRRCTLVDFGCAQITVVDSDRGRVIASYAAGWRRYDWTSWGTNYTDRVRGAARRPAWSPDGTQLAFVAGFVCPCLPEQIDTTRVEIVRLARGARRIVELQSPTVASLAWAPDGRRLVARMWVAPRYDLAVVNLRTGAARGLTDEWGGHSADWQPRCSAYGRAGRDRLTGTNGRDVLCGLAGDDVLRADRGNDVLLGGVGNDRLDGGPGRDRLFGAFGDDAILAGDGERDVIGCGPGSDRAVADRIDLVAPDCERVVRR